MCLVLRKISEHLNSIEDNLSKLQGTVVSTDKYYHIYEIYAHNQHIRYHLLQINVVKEAGVLKMTEGEKIDRGCDVPAEVIENKLEVPKAQINFRDKKMRKASSWKYLAKWESILEEHWAQRNSKEYDFRGINIVVPRRKQSIKKRLHVSSTKEDFLDEMCMKKSSSTECVLDRDSNSSILENFEKKYVSENDLNRISLDLGCVDVSDCNYLLSLQDLERIGNLKKAAEEQAKQILKESNRKASETKTPTRNSLLHKPKIVGVVYKMRL